MTHEELKAKALKKVGVKNEYEKLELEFKLFNEMLTARKKVGLNQEQVADIMGTKQAAITRLESSLTSGEHSPSISTLKKYADAVGCYLDIRLVSNPSHGQAQA